MGLPMRVAIVFNVACLWALTIILCVLVGDLRHDRPVPVPPAAITPTWTEQCNTTRTFRVVVSSAGGVAITPDPSCAETRP